MTKVIKSEEEKIEKLEIKKRKVKIAIEEILKVKKNLLILKAFSGAINIPFIQKFERKR